MESFRDLKAFRKQAYNLLCKGKDSLFDLMDAALTSRSPSSFAELSLSPLYRRQWSSLYKVLERSRPPHQALMDLYCEHLPSREPVVLVGDHSAWPRLWSKSLKERTYEHHPQASPGGKPITVGQGYSSLVCIPELSGSWALPLLHERITSFETPLEKAAQQLEQACQHLKHRPLSLWDSEYGCARFLSLTAHIACDKVMRLRPNRILYGPPPPYQGVGRPRKHGEKFKLKQPSTWPVPNQQLEMRDDRLGQLRLRCWFQMHFRQAAHLSVQLILVERLDESAQRTHRPLWLVATGEELPALESVWRLYLRRFCIEHWYRFIKQRLHWCLPHLGTSTQTETWSALMPLLSWQLWLARNHMQDNPLPWQTPMAHPTPGRAANGFAAVLANIGTPAQPPKPRGKSPGWPIGKPRTPRKRFPTVRKSYSKPKSSPKVAA